MQETSGASGLATAGIADMADSELEALRAELAKWQARVPKLAGALRERTNEVEALRSQLAERPMGDPLPASDNGSGIQARDALIEELEAAMAQLDVDALALLQTFSDAYELMDCLVTATLLPRGSARGRVAAIDESGDLVLESTTGMLERVMPSSLRSLDPA